MAARPPKIRALRQHDKWSRALPFHTMQGENESRVQLGVNSLCGIQHGEGEKKSITATNTLVNIKRIMLHCTGGWL